VGLAAEAGQTARVASVGTPAGANAGLTPALFPTGATPAVTTPRLTAGTGATFDTTDVDGGTVDAYGTTTALTLTGGVWTQWAGSLGSIVCDGGTVRIRFSGTVTSAVFRGPDATCDMAGDPRAVTFTDGEFTAGAVLRDPNRRHNLNMHPAILTHTSHRNSRTSTIPRHIKTERNRIQRHRIGVL
jgi:hypothetical protein